MGEVSYDLYDLTMVREMFRKNCDVATEGDIPRLLYYTNVYASQLPARLQEKGLDELFKIFFERFPQFRQLLQGESSHFLPMGRGRINNVVVDFYQYATRRATSTGGGGTIK